jgi:transcriptional regulator with XRE-family HTH domain
MLSTVDKYVIQKVKEKRLAKGISQSQLAFELDVSNGFIGMIESGKYAQKYNVNHLNEIAKILECSPQEFLPKNPL